MDLFDLYAKLNLDSKGFESGVAAAKSKMTGLATNLKSVGNTLSSVGNKLTGIGMSLTATVTAPVVALGVSAAKTAVSFLKLKENTVIAFTTMFGSAKKATDMVEDLYDFAQKMPYSYQSYLEASKALVSMGVSASDVIPYLTDLSDAAAATGTGSEGITTLSTAIGRMSSKGKVQLQELQVFTNMGVQAVDILGNSYGVTTEKIYDMMEKGELLADKALPKLLAGMRDGTTGVNGATAAYGGLAESMSGTLSGAIDTVSARWRDFSTKLFDSENAYPVLTKMINNFATAIQKLPKVFESFSKKVAPFMEKVNEKIEQFSQWIDKASDEDIQKLVMGIGALIALGPGLILLGTSIKILGAAFSGLSFIVSPAGLIVVGIAALAAGFIYLWNTCEAFRNFWIKLWDIVSTAFMSFLERTGILKVFQSIGEKAVELWGKLSQLKDFFIVLGTVVGAILAPAFAIISGTITGLIKAFDGLITVLNGAIDFLSGFGEILVGIFTFDGEKIKNGFKLLWNGIKEIFVGAWNTIWGYLKGYVEGFISFFSSVFDSLLEKLGIKDALDKIWKAVSEWFDKLKENIVLKLDAIKSKFNEWKTSISNWFTDNKNTLVNGFASWWGGVTTWFDEKKEIVSIKFEEIKSEVKKIMDDPNYLITLMDGWTNSLNSWSAEKINLVLVEFEKWITKISEWFTEKKDTFVNGFNSWWGGVTEWFAGLPMALQVSLGLLAAPIATFFPETWAKVGAWFEENKNTLVDNFNIWWNNLITWFDETKENIPKKFEEWGKKISDWFTEKKDTFVNGLKDWWNSAGEWIKQTAQDIPKKFEEWKNTISVWFKNLGKTNMDTMGDGITEKTKDPNFILKLGQTILKLLGAAVVAVAVAIIGVGWAIVDYLWQGLKLGWNWMINEVPKLIGKLGTKIEEIFNNISRTVGGWIEKIKGFFNFSWSLPKLKMPHFSVSGSFSLNPLSVPSFGIDWYAKGGILNDPTLFGINPFSGNAMIGGESGPEAIAPISTLQNYIKESMEEVNKKDSTKDTLENITSLLKTYLPDLANMQVYLNGGALIGGLAPGIDTSLGVTNALKARGNA